MAEPDPRPDPLREPGETGEPGGVLDLPGDPSLHTEYQGNPTRANLFVAIL